VIVFFTLIHWGINDFIFLVSKWKAVIFSGMKSGYDFYIKFYGILVRCQVTFNLIYSHKSQKPEE